MEEPNRLPPFPIAEEVFASALPNVGADCSNSDATCSEEGTIKKQKRKKGKTGVRIEISREKLLQCSKMRIGNAARELNVSSSTLKRICRDYGIPRWPPRKIDKVGAPQPSRDVPAHHIDKVGTPQPSRVVLQEGISQLTSDVPPNQASDGRDCRIHLGPPQNRNKVGADDVHIQPHNVASREMEMVMIKAKYSKYTIKFRLSLSSGMQELQLEVAKRLHLEAGTYDICYKDEDDDFILIACDEDLQCCMQTSRSLGSTTVRIVILPCSK